MKIYLLLFAMSLAALSCHHQPKNNKIPAIRDTSTWYDIPDDPLPWKGDSLIEVNEKGDTVVNIYRTPKKCIIDVNNRLGWDDENAVYWANCHVTYTHPDKNGTIHMRIDPLKSGTMYGLKNLPPAVFIIGKDTISTYAGDTLTYSVVHKVSKKK